MSNTTSRSTSSDPSTDDVNTLLRLGVRHFSRGNVDQANAAWNRVLEMEPKHPRATDYLTNSMVEMEVDRDPAEAMKSASTVLNAYGDAVDDLKQLHRVIVNLVKSGDLEEALVLLEHGREEIEDGEETFGRVRKLVRNLLALRYAARLGPLNQRVHGREDRAPTDLSPEEMHVLALVDVNASEGPMTMEALMEDSLYGPFLTLRALVVLRHRGLVTLTPGEEPEAAQGDAEAGLDDVPPPPEPAPVEEQRRDDAALDDRTGDAPGAAAPDDAPVREDAETDSVVAEPAPAATDVEDAASTSPGDGAEVSSGEDATPATEEEDFDDEYRTLFRTGVSKYVQGEFEEARTYFERCIELRPDDPRAKRNLERLETPDE